jgi:hypothetical protein
MKHIKKYLKQIDMIDLYITKNICNLIHDKNELEIIKSNIFVLGFNNKNRKHSIRILLDNNKYDIVKELILHNSDILNYKNTNETNLFQMIIIIDYFYELIIKLLEELDYYFLLKIITSKDSHNIDSIDLLISIILVNENLLVDFKNINNYKAFIYIKKILKLIYELDREDITLLINKLCKNIKNDKLLLNILEYINPQNIDIYPDNSMFTCIDYLLVKNSIEILEYLIPKINYIYFVNSENNVLFNFIENIDINIEHSITKKRIIKIIFDILSKSNIKKIKNIKNENIFFKLIKYINIDKKILKKYIDINEQNIYGYSILNIINKDNKIIIPYKKYNKINIFKNILEITEIGIFTSEIIHNMIYTILLLEKYKNIIIPYYVQDKNYNAKHQNMLNLSNNDDYINILLKSYFTSFNTFLPLIIIWKNIDNYFIDPNLLNFIVNNINNIKNNKNDYIYIRLSLNLINNDLNNYVRHANIIIIDKKNKIVERFEPYGEIDYINSNNINLIIDDIIAKPINYKYKFIQSYPGFQFRSDEFNKYNKLYGDPNGFCLAWCLLYIEIKLLLDKYHLKKINPIDYINWYIINKFKKDFPDIISDTQNNIYMIFIRYYGKNLDTLKKKLLKKLDINENLLYHNNLNRNNFNIIVEKLNKLLYKILNIK